jgi:hypothetical protein
MQDRPGCDHARSARDCERLLGRHESGALIAEEPMDMAIGGLHVAAKSSFL